MRSRRRSNRVIIVGVLIVALIWCACFAVFISQYSTAPSIQDQSARLLTEAYGTVYFGLTQTAAP